MLLKGTGIVTGGAYFFYHTKAAVIFLLPLLIPYYREQKKQASEKRREQLMLQFKEAVATVSTAMQAGNSAENAFVRAKEEMKLLYGGNSDIYIELCRIVQAAESNIPIEQVLLDFGNRSGVIEILDFAQVFAMGKRSSGNIQRIIQNTVSLIAEKIEVKREIRTALSAKVMEQRIMSVMPFAILLYIGVTSPGFFDVLYHNPAGIIIMTVCLFIYMGALVLSKRIVTIQI